MSVKPSLELVAITKQYGDTIAVDGISLEIPQGSYTCLLGPSGCGKSSTLRMIAGHESVTIGDIILDNKNITDLEPAKRGTAMMFQSYALFPHLSVLENVAFSLKMKAVAKDERTKKALETLDLVDMTAFADRLPAQLSGGQQQRVALARALITNPSILLLDEPLSALDPFLRLRMRGELKRLQRELGIPFVHVTHSQDEALALADMVVVMNEGKIEQAGSAFDVFNKPETEFVARFMGGHNVLENNETSIAIRADKIVLAAKKTKAKPSFEATISAIEYLGTSYSVTTKTSNDTDITIIVPDADFSNRSFEIGQSVFLNWKTQDAHLLTTNPKAN